MNLGKDQQDIKTSPERSSRLTKHGALMANENLNAYPETLEQLAGNDSGHIRKEVAYNPKTPSGALEQLAGDDDPGVRQGVAENLSTYPETLEQLAGDTDLGVRQGVAYNPKTPTPTVILLTADEDKNVSTVAKESSSARSLSTVLWAMGGAGV